MSPEILVISNKVDPTIVYISQKGGGSVVQGPGVYKKEGTGTFPIQFFQALSFLYLEITLNLAKLCSALEERFFLPP